MLFLSLKKIDSFGKMQEILENAEMRVSIWGGRNVYAKGVYFSTSLDQLAYKVFILVLKNEEFNQEERKQLRKVEEVIDNFYEKAELEYKNCKNPITKKLYFIRNIFLEWFDTEYWRDLNNVNASKLYTRSQYKDCFGHEPQHNIQGTSRGGLQQWTIPRI